MPAQTRIIHYYVCLGAAGGKEWKVNMEKFINEKVVVYISKFTNTKVIKALKDGMMFSLPFLMIGSLFLLIANLPIKSLNTLVAECGLADICSQVYSSTFSLMALFTVVGITYSYLKNDKISTAVNGALTGLAAFVLLTPSSKVLENGEAVTGVISKDWTAGQGMICAILIGFLVGYIYSLCIRKDIRVTMPEGVPPGVADSFSSLLPTGIITIICAIIYAVCHFVFKTTFAELIYSAIQIPLQGVTDSFAGVVIMTVMMSLLWWTGVHGGSICGGILSPILQANMAANQKILDSGVALTVQNGGHIFTQQFWDNFLCMSGAGIVIGLVIYITFFAKSESLRSLGKLSIVPNIFNINEPIIFGTPIVLNIYLLIPFVLVPLIIGISSYLLMYFGILPLFSGVMVPWTTPPIISGFLIGGWKVALWQLVMIIISFVVYFPFIKKIDTLSSKNENK